LGFRLIATQRPFWARDSSDFRKARPIETKSRDAEIGPKPAGAIANYQWSTTDLERRPSRRSLLDSPGQDQERNEVHLMRLAPPAWTDRGPRPEAKSLDGRPDGGVTPRSLVPRSFSWTSWSSGAPAAATSSGVRHSHTNRPDRVTRYSRSVRPPRSTVIGRRGQPPGATIVVKGPRYAGRPGAPTAAACGRRPGWCSSRTACRVRPGGYWPITSGWPTAGRPHVWPAGP
jgi:hypothetical protein